MRTGSPAGWPDEQTRVAHRPQQPDGCGRPWYRTGSGPSAGPTKITRTLLTERATTDCNENVRQAVAQGPAPALAGRPGVSVTILIETTPGRASRWPGEPRGGPRPRCACSPTARPRSPSARPFAATTPRQRACPTAGNRPSPLVPGVGFSP